MARKKVVTIDGKLETVLLRLYGGEMPVCIDQHTVGALASLVIGSDNARARRKLRASLRRQKVRVM